MNFCPSQFPSWYEADIQYEEEDFLWPHLGMELLTKMVSPQYANVSDHRGSKSYKKREDSVTLHSSHSGHKLIHLQ